MKEKYYIIAEIAGSLGAYCNYYTMKKTLFLNHTKCRNKYKIRYKVAYKTYDLAFSEIVRLNKKGINNLFVSTEKGNKNLEY